MEKTFRKEADEIIRKYIDVERLIKTEKDSDFTQDYEDMLDELARLGLSILNGIIR
jgi:hypothetical protein